MRSELQVKSLDNFDFQTDLSNNVMRADPSFFGKEITSLKSFLIFIVQ